VDDNVIDLPGAPYRAPSRFSKTGRHSGYSWGKHVEVSLNRLFLIFILALNLTSCAAPARFAWTKAGVSAYDTDSALAECRYQVGLSKVGPYQEPHVVNQCMMGKGFRYERVSR